jgi:hypothetical protein
MQAYHINQRIDWWVQLLKLRRQREGWAYKRDVDSGQTGTLFSHWVISEAVDLGFQFGLYG